jgi:hypothetical protein
VPYFLGYQFVEDDWVFTGILMNPEDSQSYFAKMNQGYLGEWRYHIPFTPEDHEGAFVGGFYLFLGHAARVFDLSLTAAWHIARYLSGFLLFIVTYVFTSHFFDKRTERWSAYILAVTGSGLGWLVFATLRTEWLGAFPVDLKMPESHLIFTALTFPHFALGTASILATFWLVLQFTSGGHRSWIYAVFSGMANLILAILYPFMIYLALAVTSVYWFYLCVRNRRVEWRSGVQIAVSFIIPAPLLIYYATVLRGNWAFQSWADQAVTLSPPWPHYLLAFGPMLLVGLLSFPIGKRSSEKGTRRSFIWVWIVVAAILVYVPLNHQRRYVQGVHVALAIAATIGLFEVVLPRLLSTKFVQKLARYRRYSIPGIQQLIVFSFLLFMSFSNIYLLADVSLSKVRNQHFGLFRFKQEMKAVTWLVENTKREGVVIAAYETGNLVAAQSGNPVVLGHWAETIDFDVKTSEVDRFFSSSTPEEWRMSLLDKYDVAYLWHGPLERAVGDFNPEGAPYLNLIYEQPPISIYLVE